MPKVVPEYKAQARKRILHAATAEFAKRGYRATTMNDIADRLKVSKGAIYQYFPSKEDLLRELAGTYIEGLLKDTSMPLERDIIDTNGGSFGRVVEDTPDWIFGLAMEMYADARYNQELKRLLQDLEKRHGEALCEYLDERKKAGELPKDLDSAALASVCLALETGIMAKLASGTPRSEASRIWKEFLQGMSAGFEIKRK